VVAGVDQGGDGEAAAGGFAREGDVRWGGAVVEEGLVGGEGVVDRGRIRVTCAARPAAWTASPST
jgi:hypothetical protein